MFICWQGGGCSCVGRAGAACKSCVIQEGGYLLCACLCVPSNVCTFSWSWSHSPRIHTHTFTLSNTHTHTHTFTATICTFSWSWSDPPRIHTHKHTHSFTLSDTHTHTFKHTHTHSLAQFARFHGADHIHHTPSHTQTHIHCHNRHIAYPIHIACCVISSSCSLPHSTNAFTATIAQCKAHVGLFRHNQVRTNGLSHFSCVWRVWYGSDSFWCLDCGEGLSPPAQLFFPFLKLNIHKIVMPATQ